MRTYNTFLLFFYAVVLRKIFAVSWSKLKKKINTKENERF